MIGLAGMTYLGDIGGPRVSQVAGLRIVLKRRVLAVVIIHDEYTYRISMTPLTSRGAVWIDRLQIEAALRTNPSLCPFAFSRSPMFNPDI